jgi:hypothetical protein
MMGGANHLGMGERPSESHHWIPGMGWVFMPSFAEGESMAEQSAANAGSNGFNINVSGDSLADAQNSGVTNHYVAQGSSIPSADAAKIRARQASHDWYTGGMDHYGGPVDNGHEWRAAAGQWVNDRNGKPTISPWINTFDHDAENTFNRMREDNYNAFLGSEGRWVGDEQAGIGELNGYRDDSIAAWFKEQFAGDDMVKHRADALRTLNGWNTQVRNPDYQSNMDRSEKWMNGQGHGINKGSTRMSRKFFDEMGLGDKFGLEWVEPESGASKLLNGTAEGGPSQAAKMLQGGGGIGGRAGEMLRGGLMSGGGDAMRDVIYGKAQEKIFGE